MTRTRGTMVRTLVLPDNGERPIYTYALAVSAGRVYVICSEGVGWEVSSDRPLFVDTMSGGYELDLAAVMTAGSLGETVDLADHVRTFGSRLESNFHMWLRRLSPAAGCPDCIGYPCECGTAGGGC